MTWHGRSIVITDEHGNVIGKLFVRVAKSKDFLNCQVELRDDKLILVTDQKFTGWIDQLTLYNKALKSVEITNMMNPNKKEKVIFT